MRRLEKFLFKSHEWSYEGECGPQTWQRDYSAAGGKYQSPVDIQTDVAVYDAALSTEQRPLLVDYDAHSCSHIKNTGHTFQVDGFADNNSSRSLFCEIV